MLDAIRDWSFREICIFVIAQIPYYGAQTKAEKAMLRALLNILATIEITRWPTQTNFLPQKLRKNQPLHWLVNVTRSKNMQLKRAYYFSDHVIIREHSLPQLIKWPHRDRLKSAGFLLALRLDGIEKNRNIKKTLKKKMMA